MLLQPQEQHFLVCIKDVKIQGNIKKISGPMVSMGRVPRVQEDSE